MTMYNTLVPSFTRIKAASDLARVLLAVFPTPSADARRLVSLVLGSVCKFFDEDESVPQLIESHIDQVIQLELSDYLMALASRVGVDLRNTRWTGDAKSDVRMMYTRVIFKLTSDLLDDTHGDLDSRIDSLQRSLPKTQSMLIWMSDERLLDEVESAADAYQVQRTRAVTLDEREWAMRRKKMAYQRLRRAGASFKSAIWGMKSSTKEYKADVNEVVSGLSKDGSASDSGVSMGGYDGESECDESVWGVDDIGVAL